MKNKIPSVKNSENKPKYQPPVVESEAIFEQNALACGKCRAASHRQHACMRLPSIS